MTQVHSGLLHLWLFQPPALPCGHGYRPTEASSLLAPPVLPTRAQAWCFSQVHLSPDIYEAPARCPYKVGLSLLIFQELCRCSLRCWPPHCWEITPPPPVPRQTGHVVGTVAVGDPKCGPQKNECPLALPSVSAEMIQFRGMLSAASGVLT